MGAGEKRGAAYSSCWSSQVNHHLGKHCVDQDQPFLPLDWLLFRKFQDWLGVAPSRNLILSKGDLGVEGREAVAREIIRYIDQATRLQGGNMKQHGSCPRG